MKFYRSEEDNRLRRLVHWVVDVIVVIAFALFLVFAYGTQIPIAGHSMMPLLESGDVVLMDRLTYDFGKPGRFDVVVFEREDKKLNVKRIIGLPGETVQIKGGQVYINDQLLNEPEGLCSISLSGIAQSPVKLGKSEYFLLGDNRDSSEDSRFANVGNVSGKQILGKVWIRILPLANLDFLGAE